MGQNAVYDLAYFSTHSFLLSKTEDLAFGYDVLQSSILTSALTESSHSHNLKGHADAYHLEVDCKE